MSLTLGQETKTTRRKRLDKMALPIQTPHDPASMQEQQQLQQLTTYKRPLLTMSTSRLLAIVNPALSTTLLFFSYLQLFLRSYPVATAVLLLSHTFKITRALMWHSIAISYLLLKNTIRTTMHIITEVYTRSEPARQKLFFEFMVFILNPGLGHGLCVILFWPGWLVLWPVLIGYWLLR